MPKLIEIARAKVNLTLRVIGRRPDGYHELASLVAFADIGDMLTLEPSGSISLTVTGPFGSRLQGTNIVATAVDRARAACGELTAGTIVIDKRLPVAAGIGGGSADAAAALRLLERANPEVAAKVDWRRLSEGLGADVPVCLRSKASFMTGIGGELNEVPGLPPLPAVLVNAMVPVPEDKTAQVFRQLKAEPLPSAVPRLRPPASFRCVEDALIYLSQASNDLEPPARSLLPAIGDVLAAIGTSDGCRLVRMSGAGPTCFGLYGSKQAAREAATELHRRHPDWWIVATTLS